MEESNSVVIDDVYEFSAPRFFDFVVGESAEAMREAELWFDTALSYAPSPFMPRIKAGRTVQLDSLCDFSEAEQPQKESIPLPASNSTVEVIIGPEKDQTRPQSLPEKEVISGETKEVNANLADEAVLDDTIKSCVTKEMTYLENDTRNADPSNPEDKKLTVEKEMCTPKALQGLSRKGDLSQTQSRMQTVQKIASMMRNPSAPQTQSRMQTVQKIASMVRNPSALKPKPQSQLSHAKGTKPASSRKDGILKNVIGTPIFAQENQAIKRQKLEGGWSRQILNVKPQVLPHKLRLGLSSNFSSSTVKAHERKVYVREPAAPFVSMAEMMRKFQSGTRDISLPPRGSSVTHDDSSSTVRRNFKLTLTRPKEPEFETSQRSRPVHIKSFDELEEEMMAKIPKFKARPLNKKIFEAHLPPVPQRTPHLPEFKEFHLETMARANKHAETSSVVSTESASQNHKWKPHLTAPKSPLLQTSLRARPLKIKTSEELEREELEKAPKFKARPLNKKIFESKGELGIFCNTKRQVTIPQEFHFAVDERIPPPAMVADLFDKMSITSEPRHEKQLPRITAPNPFNLRTDERGAEKEKKFIMEVVRKQIEEEIARIPKATPYPYTTDYPVVPPKPEPKSCTQPEPFQLESLARHEEEMQREMEERQRMEMEQAHMRLFKAQPILKDDLIPVPEKVRKPLTEVQEFNLHVVHRAVDRAEFDKKIKEKEMMYKRYRDEAESAMMMEEEKALKQLRRTLVPHARPVPNFSHSSLPNKCVKEVTKPKSPKLNVDKRRERRKYIGAGASSAAFRMR